MAVSDVQPTATRQGTTDQPRAGEKTRRRPTVMVDGLHVIYKVFGARVVKPGSSRSTNSRVARILRRDSKGITEVHAIRGVSFVTYEGESIGLVGANGSGKSTLLRAIAGTLTPARGKVLAHGKPTLLGVNAALVPRLTGAQNIELGCLALGMSPTELRARYDEIVEFSGIGEFIELPMTAYSSGMSARLRFAIASSVSHEVLLIDEALATGDAAFRARSEERIRQLRGEASTVFLVSHDLGTVLETCTRGIWLDRGLVRMDGPMEAVVAAYTADVEAGGSGPPTSTGAPSGK